MPRNSSGTMSLPSGNPVVTGTTISTTWANNTLGDVSTELTDSLSRSGKGGMSAPLRTTDGSVSAPSLSFTNETGSGFFRSGSSDWQATVAGTAVWKFLAGLVETVSGVIRSAVADGASAIAFKLNTAAAYSTSGAKLLALQNNGTNKFTVDKDGAVTASSTVTATGFTGITRPNLPTVGQQISSSTAGFSTSSTTYTDVTNATVTITTTGRPVILSLQPDTTVGGGGINISPAGAQTSTQARLKLIRASTDIAIFSIGATGASSALLGGTWPTPLLFVDAPAAGTYTYKFQAQSDAVSLATIGVPNCKLVAYEL